MSILLIIFILLVIWRCIAGFRAGMVREIISIVSLVVLAFAIMLLGSAFQSYTHKELTKLIVAVVLLLILVILHRIVSLILSSIKLISKLPVIHFADRIMGGILGSLEAVVVMWVIYYAVMQWGLGMLGQQILILTKESKLLTWLYGHNYLAYWVQLFVGKMSLKI